MRKILVFILMGTLSGVSVAEEPCVKEKASARRASDSEADLMDSTDPVARRNASNAVKEADVSLGRCKVNTYWARVRAEDAATIRACAKEAESARDEALRESDANARQDSPALAEAGSHRPAADAFDQCSKAAHLEQEDARRKKTEERERRAQLLRATEVALSAGLCFNASYRSDSLKEIAKQKKYSKLGGVQDLAAINEQQNYVRAADEADETLHAAMKQLGLKAMRCAEPRVAAVKACLQQNVRSNAIQDGFPDGCDKVSEALNVLPIRDLNDPVSFTQ